jgi:DNA-binding NarL/FixJ family response regulator
MVAAEAGDGREAVKKTIEITPDIVIVEIGMPDLNGLEATRQIIKQVRHVKVLVLTVHDSDNVIHEVLESGAHGYLLKTDAGTDLIRAVRSLQDGKRFFTDKVSQMLLNGYLRRNVESNGDGRVTSVLTGRQREILQLLAEGKSSKETAADLNLSVKTVETHELVRYAVRNEIIQA